MNASGKNYTFLISKRNIFKPQWGYPTQVSEMQTPTPGSGIPLHEFLAQNEFYLDRNIADIIEKIANTSDRKAFLLRGPAGVGKTQLTFLVAKWLGAEYIYFQCTYGVDEDSLLYKYVPDETTKSGIKITLGPVPRALKISQRKKVVLVLDEFDKTRPSADALLLDMLQNFRVSLYISDNESIITGNPENLVIFLTSNSLREFSEPLLRRLVVITLKPLPTTVVYEMLKRQFRENIALLLTQIYDDTIRTGLRKPATIQELQQLGQILENGANAPLQELLRMFIIKYDDDWVKFTQYVSSREPYKFVNDNASNNDVTQYYEPPQEVQIPQPQQSQSQKQTQQLLEKISRIVVKQPSDSVVKAVKEEVNDVVESTFKASINDDFVAYTNIIKALKPEPTDTPDIFGKFKVIKDTDGYKIMGEKPLSLLEYLQLLNNSGEIEFEGYIEDKLVLVNPMAINEIIENADAVRYYSNRKIQAVFNDKYRSITELIELEVDNYSPNKPNSLSETTIRMYVNVKKHGSFSSLMMNLISRLYDVNVNAPNDPEVLVKFIRQIIEYRRHHLNPGVGITLRFGSVEEFEKTMKTLSEAFKVDMQDIDVIKSKGVAKIYYNEYYDALEVRAQ
jgi:MoxR-like ATPase